MSNNRGFTLIEIIVAVALVAILSAAIAPSVLNNIAQGRVARAQSDVQAIASAIMRFRSDVGKYPRMVYASNPDTSDAVRFDYLASVGGDWPTLGSGATWGAGAFTTEQTTLNSTEDFSNHLILGRSRAATDSLYARADNPDDPNDVGFRSALMSSDPADPWGNKYMCNVAPLGKIGEVVWVISAGPNGLLETPIQAAGTGGHGAASTLAGDDIGFRVQ